MNLAASYCGNFIPFSQCKACSARTLHPVTVIPSQYRSRECIFPVVSYSNRLRKREFARRATETETEPESNDDKDKEVHENEEKLVSADPLVEINGALDSQDIIDDQDKDNTMKGEGEFKVEGSLEQVDNLEVSTGSPLPGLKTQPGAYERIPKETIDILKDQVFGFDTFFVTSQEPYEGGVLFKGNLRGNASKSYDKITKRLQDRFEDQYKLFLLINPEDDKPVAVVVPRMILQPEATVPEWFAAGAFGLVTVFTLLLRNVPSLQSNLLSTFDNLDMLKDGLPGALVTSLVLGAHEISHILVSRSCGVKLGIPYFVPSWQIGSFGAITRIINIVPRREDLLKVAAAGPVAGFSLGFVLLLLGFFLPPSDGIGVVVDASVFHDSLLVGGIAKLLLGDALKEGTPISVNPLLIWAWAGLVINAINSIPAGELDGGRIAFSIWGRKASARITGASIVLLGLSSLFNDVAFYWVALIFFLQRGPIAPLSEEISDPDNKYVTLGVAVLVLGLLVCLPYPFPFTNESITSF